MVLQHKLTGDADHHRPTSHQIYEREKMFNSKNDKKDNKVSASKPLKKWSCYKWSTCGIFKRGQIFGIKNLNVLYEVTY